MTENSLKINGVCYEVERLKDSASLLSITDGDNAFADFLLAWFDDSDFVMGNTSGSTGTPKPIRLSKDTMRESARRTNDFFRIGETSSLLLCLSTQYIAGKMMVVRALVSGCNLCLEKPSSAPLLQGNFDLVSMVPMQVYSLRRSSDGASRLSHVRNLLVGGSPLAQEDANWLRSLSLHTYVSYGMTETVSHVALADLNDLSTDGMLVYHALPSVSFKQDDRGCLVISADYLSSEPFVTNDVVDLLTETSFLWKGRWDNVINTGGVKVHPEILEKKVASLISRPFYFVGLPDPKYGQMVVLKIEGFPYPTFALEYFLQKTLSPYEMPKEIHFLDHFERTESGKIKRK
ncbi:MAG: AMP-binding protein [Paludibacteraceae bacterium]|nr:AMP-binding protein [Paludibacteraceae bacterium]